MGKTHRIIAVNGHYEAVDELGNFVTSGDTYRECEEDLIEMLIADAKRNLKSVVIV